MLRTQSVIVSFLLWSLMAFIAAASSHSAAQQSESPFGGYSKASSNPFTDPDGEPEFLSVDEAYQVSVEIQEDNSIQLYWQIRDAYYLYQHAFKVTLTAENGEIPITISLPEALHRTDEFFGEVQVYYQQADLIVSSTELSTPPALATLSVQYQGCADAGLCYPPRDRYYQLDFTNGGVTEISRPSSGTATKNQLANAPAQASQSLWIMLLFAFLGGLILNLMPCVFPILSLKVLSFTHGEARERITHGWIYAGGVVASFVAVAIALIVLQHAGAAIGWGFQLQSPQFVVMLAYLFVVMGLSLLGAIHLGGGLMNMGNELSAKPGRLGCFFTGVLAVVVASPCTAPFMGTALGFAISQSSSVALAIFVALGAGMATPMVLLSYSKTAREIIPKPGQWMESLQQFLAYPLLATALWLFWVMGRQTNINVMTIALGGALLLSFGLWLWQRGKRIKWLGAGLAAFAIVLGYSSSNPDSGASIDSQHQAWSAAKFAELRNAGEPVFVDVTADWCITCLANEKTVLNSEAVIDAFDKSDIHYLVADWTNYDADIADFIHRHKRDGIPLYVLYGKGSAEPIILPQILTRDTVIEAINAVSQ